MSFYGCNRCCVARGPQGPHGPPGPTGPTGSSGLSSSARLTFQPPLQKSNDNVVSLRDDELVSTGNTDQTVTREKTFQQIHIGMDPQSYSLSLFHVSSGYANDNVQITPPDAVTWGTESGAGFVEATVVASVATFNAPTCYRVTFGIDVDGNQIQFVSNKLAGPEELDLAFQYYTILETASSFLTASCPDATGRSVRYATSLTYTRVSYES